MLAACTDWRIALTSMACSSSASSPPLKQQIRPPQFDKVGVGFRSKKTAKVPQIIIKVAIDTRYLVSQPDGYQYFTGPGVRTAIVPETTMDVSESQLKAVNLPQGATIEDLVAALKGVKASSRDVIAILQGVKRAGALHAELIIQ